MSQLWKVLASRNRCDQAVLMCTIPVMTHATRHYPAKKDKLSYIDHQVLMKYSIFTNSRGRKRPKELIHDTPGGWKFKVINHDGIPQARARDVYHAIMASAKNQLLHEDEIFLSLKKLQEITGIKRSHDIKRYCDQVAHTLLEWERKPDKKLKDNDVPDWMQMHIWTTSKEGDELKVMFDPRFIKLYRRFYKTRFKALPIETYNSLSGSFAKFAYDALHVWFDGKDKETGRYKPFWRIGFDKFLRNAGFEYYLDQPRKKQNQYIRDYIEPQLLELVELGEYIFEIDFKQRMFYFFRQYSLKGEKDFKPMTEEKMQEVINIKRTIENPDIKIKQKTKASKGILNKKAIFKRLVFWK